MFNRENLIYKDYKWDLNYTLDDPKTIENKDQTTLNRYEGNELIYYIRCLALSWNWKLDAIRSCQKLEKTIRDKVPVTLTEYGEIKFWIENNFKNFWDNL